MTIRRGRCTNVKLCNMATSQKIIDIEEDEPFICPRCSSDLAPVITRKSSPWVRGVQIGAVLVFVAGIGAEVYLDNRPKPPAPSGSAPAAAPAVVKLAAAPVPVSISPFLRLAAPDGLATTLAMRLAAGYLALSGDTAIHAQPGSQPGTIELVGEQGNASEAISISVADNSAAVAALRQNQADIAFSQTQPLAASLDNSQLLGMSAMAVVANPALKVASLSRSQLQSIYAGRIRNWSELGGPAAEIHAYWQAGSMGGPPPAAYIVPGAAEAATVLTATTEAGVVQAVANDPNAIGLVGVLQAAHARSLPIEAGGPASLPTMAAIASGAYKLASRVAFTAADNDAARRFANYATSASGLIALQAAGVAPLAKAAPTHASETAPVVQTAQPLAASNPPAAPLVAVDRFHQFIAGAAQAPVIFHFDQASTQLDRAGLRELDRLAIFLRTRHIDGTHILLAGFSDNQGTQATKETAAQKRVAAVAAALAHAGINAKSAQGFGGDVPVASDATAEGRDRNRRVEVYITP